MFAFLIEPINIFRNQNRNTLKYRMNKFFCSYEHKATVPDYLYRLFAITIIFYFLYDQFCNFRMRPTQHFYAAEKAVHNSTKGIASLAHAIKLIYDFNREERKKKMYKRKRKSKHSAENFDMYDISDQNLNDSKKSKKVRFSFAGNMNTKEQNQDALYEQKIQDISKNIDKMTRGKYRKLLNLDHDLYPYNKDLEDSSSPISTDSDSNNKEKDTSNETERSSIDSSEQQMHNSTAANYIRKRASVSSLKTQTSARDIKRVASRTSNSATNIKSNTNLSIKKTAKQETSRTSLNSKYDDDENLPKTSSTSVASNQIKTIVSRASSKSPKSSKSTESSSIAESKYGSTTTIRRRSRERNAGSSTALRSSSK